MRTNARPANRNVCCFVCAINRPKNKQNAGNQKDHGVLKICGRDAAVDYSITKEKYNALKQGTGNKAATPSPPAGDADDNEPQQGDEMEVDSDEGADANADDSEETSEDESDDDEEEHGGEEQQEEGGPDAAAGVGRAVERQRPSDVQQGCTVFVRNIAFDCGQEEVKDRFSEFGNVRLALLVKDRATGMPRGTAFVKVQWATNLFQRVCSTGSGIT